MADACTHDATLCQCQLDGALEDVMADLVAVRERYDALLGDASPRIAKLMTENALLRAALEHAQWGSGDGCNQAYENARLVARGAAPAVPVPVAIPHEGATRENEPDFSPEEIAGANADLGCSRDL